MMRLSEAASALATSLVGTDVAIHSVSTDTRTLTAGALFVALRGEHFNGHDYVPTAIERGAVAALVDAASIDAGQASAQWSIPLLPVRDTKRALGLLARYWRSKFDIPLVTVSGSNGKTTVKEMTATILRAHYGDDATLSTVGNFNNDIGLPLTLLRLREAHRCAVIEVGMNHAGETAYLADLAQPTIALVNNAQREHQEFMRTVSDVAIEHAASIAALPAQGVAVFNGDDAHAYVWRSAAGGRTVRDFGLDSACAVHATPRLTASGSEFDLHTPEGRVHVDLNVPGLHNVRNALAAAAAATAAGASLDAVARGLNAFEAVKGRLQRKAGRQGAQLIDDTYNANPDSVRAAIDVLVQANGLRVLVLGDMGEVGTEGPAFHQEIGAYARQAGIDRLYAVGELAREAVHAFGAGAQHCASTDDIVAQLQSLLAQRPSVLIKGSRFMRMERVVEQLEAGKA
jgi:UDP-N-acetylmuramoyl-tripeptide--D-alanyl-D-alanine ligase